MPSPTTPMKTSITLRPVLLVAAAFLAGCNASPTAPSVAPGFTADVHGDIGPGHGADSKRWPAPQPVFAADLSNAEFKPGSWAWENGVLVAKGGGDLWTKENYGDFVLNLDFRCEERANSGVFLRCSDVANWLNTAMEVQILQGDAPEKHLVGAVYDCVAPTRQIEIVPGTWYHYTITAIGSHIKVVLNGEKLVDMNLDLWKEAGKNPDGTPNKFTTAYKDMARSGRIGLQYHTNKVEFRNIVIDRL